MIRRNVLRPSIAFVGVALAASTTSTARAETLSQCQAWKDDIPAASVAACTALYESALAARAKRTMYEVDPAQLPHRLYSTRSDDFTTGAYDEYDKRQVRERSSDGTFRTADALGVRRDASTSYELAFPWLAGPVIPTIPPVGGLPGTPFISYPSTLTGSLAVPSMGLPLYFVDPETFKAHTAWETRKDTFLSCSEYAWKLFYGHSRFVDSAKVCGNDAECIGDLTYASPPPGIAYDVIRDVNGAPSRLPGAASNSTLSLLNGAPSKNLFFATSPWYLRDQKDALTTALAKYELDENRVRNRGGCAWMQPGPYAACSDYITLTGPTHQNDGPDQIAATRVKMTAIDSLLRKKLFYSVGTSWIAPILKALGSTQIEAFPSEWQFHAAMRARQPLGITLAERRAIEERTAYLEKLLSSYVETTSLRACKAPPMAQGPNGDDLLDGRGGDIIDVIGTGSPDPWVKRWAVGSLSTPLVANGSGFLSPIGLVEGSQTRINVPALVGANARPSGFTSFSLGSLLDGFRSTRGRPNQGPNQTPTPLPNQGPNQTPTANQGPSQAPVPMSSTVSIPGGPAGLANVGVLGLLPPGLQAIVRGARCDADVSKKGATLSPRLGAVLTRATQIQQEIADLLVEEYDRGPEGCLAETNYRCDWSPALLAARFVEQLATEKQSALDTCNTYTAGGDLTEATSLGKNKVSSFASYIATKKAADALALRELPSKTVGTKTVAGDADHGDFTRGDGEWFGAGYTYDIGWTLDPIHKSGTGDRAVCGVLAEAHARFEANASLLDPIIDPLCPDIVTVWPAEGSQALGATPLSALSAGIEFCKLHARLKHLIDVNAQVTTAATAGSDASSGSFDGEIMVANERLFSVDGTFTVPSVQEGETLLFRVDGVVGPPPIETERASVTVVIVVVPVTVQAWGELHVGAQITGKAHQVATCSGGPASVAFKTSLGFAPFAKGTARASVAVGISGLQAGVRGSVTLIDARLPIEAGLVAGLDGTGLRIQPSFTGRVTATFLSGSLSAFAEVGFKPFRYTAEKEIFAFEGFQRNLGLWNYTPPAIELSAFRSASWTNWRNERAASGASP